MKRLTWLIVLLPALLTAADFEHTSSLFAAFSQPMGDFGATDTEMAGFADLGFGGGADYTFFWEETGLGWTSMLTYMTNQYGGDVFNKDINMEIIEATAFENLAFLTGIKYQYEFSDMLSVFVNARYGYHRLTPPEFNGTILVSEDEQYRGAMNFDHTNGACYSIGAGFNMNRTFNLSVNYYDFGTHTYTNTVQLGSGEDASRVDIEWEQPIALLLVTLGYNIEF